MFVVVVVLMDFLNGMNTDVEVSVCVNDAASASLESSASTYDSMLQSLQNELNNGADFAEFEDPEFFKMDCATAVSFDYEMNYTIKQLKHIAGYYGLKCKPRKVELIQDIVLFEMDADNSDAVARRKRLFHYIDILKTDDYLKTYIML
jgi:hypothetical protein